MSTGAPCLVAATDDARLARDDFDDRLEQLLASGLPAVWIRATEIDDRSLSEIVERTRRATSRSGAALWVGGRPDMARAFDADAVQLPGTGMSISGARRVVGERIRIGRSVHGVEPARAAATEGADQIVAGTIFASRTHPDIEPAGPGLLRQIREVVKAAGQPIPVYGIGGLTPENAAAAVRAGASGVVAIRALWEAPDPSSAVPEFLEAIGRWAKPTLH